MSKLVDSSVSVSGSVKDVVSSSSSLSSSSSSSPPSSSSSSSSGLSSSSSSSEPLPMSNRVKGLVAMAVNVVCAVLIIPFNKWLFKTLAFKWVLALGLIHYCVTYLSTVALIWSGAVENKPFSHFREFLPICVMNTASICLLNLSLATNSIGVYQLAKMLTVPGTVLCSYVMYGRTYSLEVLGSLATMTAGIGLAVGGRVSIDFVGATFALVAVAVVCVSSVMTSELQKKYKLDPTVLMYNIMPPQMAMLAVITMVFEPVFPGQPGSIWAYNWTLEAWFYVIATALFALLLNLSGLWVLGIFSPVTFSVVGYGKTASVLATGILIFGDEFTLPIFFGILLVFGGAAWYNKAQ